MILLNIFVQAAIILAVVVIFFLALFLNKRTKAPKDIELPEKCRFCPSETCVIKIADADRKKEELKAFLENCEDKDGSEKTD